MKRFWVFLGLTGALVLIPSPNQTAQAHTQYMSAGMSFGNVGFFYGHLRSYGEWIEIEPGFYGWRPARVRYGWRPYLNGRWVWTDYGWYWVSYEPFGWAVFHYGRWYYDDYYGWIWIPDSIWGPAWVEWRYDDDYIGWAPLPPYASFSISIGIRFTTRWVAPHSYWCFVRYQNFAATRIDGYVVDERNTRRLIRTTRGAMRYEVDGDRIINRGVDRTHIERRGHVRISRTEVGEARDRNERIVRDGSRERVEAYRPSRTDLERQEGRIEARRPERRLSLDLNRIDRSTNRRETENRPKTDRREERTPGEKRTYERVPVPKQKEIRRSDPRRESRDREVPAREDERSQPGVRRDSPDRRSTPQRRGEGSEFRSYQPERQSIQRSPERSGPFRREAPSVRSQPQRREGDPSSSPSPRSRTESKRRGH